MVLLKHGESLQFSSSDIKPAELIENDPFVMEQFKKIANNLKKIAPRANDFLYFSAAMMHSAERSLYNDDGTIKKDANGNPVEAHWEINENTGSWKWVCSDPNVKPYKNCFIPGTKITMEDGSVKNIEDVVAGEKVISHTGKAQKVLRTFVTPHNGEILELYVSNNKPITCTTEHPFYILRNETKDSSLNRVLKNKKYSLLFTEGNKIKEKDSFLQPIVNKVVESKLSEKKARILGLYAAEGCTKEYETIFSLGSHEKEMAKEYIELINDEYPDCSAHINKSETQPTKLTISVYGKSLREDCDKHVGNLSYAKKLSKEIVFGIKEIKENFIIGWMEGDGHVDKESGKLVGTTTSPHLANQTRIMLNSLGINSSLYKEKPAAPSQLKDGRIITGKHDIYRVKISRNNSKDLIKTSNKLHFEKEVKDRKPISFIDNYQILQYLGSDKKHYEGNVYNLEVENDNSYIADGIATHNCNLDIFPEQELKKAYKKWVGKPLCKDHQSSSIDGVRGIILDTYYDDKAKQVVALCALDKVNYGPLARAVEAGYANSVSMGTAVGKSICTECGNVARVESEYCEHVRGRKAYGEINVDLAPIELSLVVNGADPLARVRTIIAQTQNIEETLKKSGGLTSVDDLMSIKQDFSALAFRIGELERELVVKDDNNFALKAVAQNNATQEEFNNGLALIKNKMANVESMIQTIANRFNTEELMSNINKAAYYNGTEEPTPGKPQYAKEEADKIRDNEDRQMKNVADTGPVDGLFPGDLEQKKMIARAKTEERRQLRAQAVAKAKTAYIQGTTEPTKYPVDPLAEKARKEDKQMNVQDVGKGVLMPGDEETKKKLLRAKLKARFVKAASPDQNRWDILNGDTVILSATFNEITGGRPSLFSSVKTAEFAKEMMKTIKEQGVDGAAKFYKAAQMPMDPMAGGMPGMGGDMGAGAGGAMPAPVDPLA
nr:LAGLIDADG family homing endonuclease [Candidatus Portnoybacteria bacterium]